MKQVSYTFRLASMALAFVSIVASLKGVSLIGVAVCPDYKVVLNIEDDVESFIKGVSAGLHHGERYAAAPETEEEDYA